MKHILCNVMGKIKYIGIDISHVITCWNSIRTISALASLVAATKWTHTNWWNSFLDILWRIARKSKRLEKYNRINTIDIYASSIICKLHYIIRKTNILFKYLNALKKFVLFPFFIASCTGNLWVVTEVRRRGREGDDIIRLLSNQRSV